MSKASELIERLERETGQRVDAEGSTAMAGLFVAMSRLLGQSPPSYREEDDVAAGLLIQHQMSPEGQREEADKQAMLSMLLMGMPPDDMAKI